MLSKSEDIVNDEDVSTTSIEVKNEPKGSDSECRIDVKVGWESESNEIQEYNTNANGASGSNGVAMGFSILTKRDEWPTGLRGMNNMGNTCFMNAVLQSLVRTPLLSEYYLKSKHFKGNCRVSSEGGHCVECELDAVISDVFQGERRPYSPTTFLHTWWMMAGGFLSGYKQQDAHEFFLFILQMLTGHPKSIATSLFIGQMQSAVTCGSCKGKSVQQDEFSHISLDVSSSGLILPRPIIPKSHTKVQRKRVGKKKTIKGGKALKLVETDISASTATQLPSGSTSAPSLWEVDGGSTEELQDTMASPPRVGLVVEKTRNSSRGKDVTTHPALAGYLRWPGDSLVGCLKRFTWPEKLESPVHSWECTKCNSTCSASKQISLLKLPPIIAFHMKRFEHLGGMQRSARKLETFISFPLDALDMRSHLESNVVLNQAGAPINKFSAPSDRSNDYLYDAYAIICHRGTFQGGHYVAYVRCSNNLWYLCDDAFVTEVPTEVVRNCQAYMILYSSQRIAPWRHK